MIQKTFLEELKGYFRLNIYEAKIWTSLLSRGIAAAGELADISGVPRSRCYDVLENLEKKGFIIMKIGKPIKYMAVQPEVIVERIKRDLEEKAKSQEEFIENIRGTDSFKELELLHKTGVENVDISELSNSITGRDNLNRFIKSMVEKAKKNVTIVTTKDGLKRKIKILKNIFPGLEKRKVNVTVFSEIDNEYKTKLPKSVKLNEFQTDARFIIVDNEELIFMSSDKDLNPEYDMGVWVKSKFFVDALSAMFEENLK
ncbi:TrmB family transcriptional regulator [Candidatus Woesearchaeota archaeon]|nr:TrmB family transcriptional regulator [Candidatus Woesearchaeota archaeon]